MFSRTRANHLIAVRFFTGAFVVLAAVWPSPLKSDSMQPDAGSSPAQLWSNEAHLAGTARRDGGCPNDRSSGVFKSRGREVPPAPPRYRTPYSGDPAPADLDRSEVGAGRRPKIEVDIRLGRRTAAGHHVRLSTSGRIASGQTSEEVADRTHSRLRDCLNPEK